VVQLIRSQYAAKIPSHVFRDAAETALVDVHERSTPLAQALLLYAIALYPTAEQVKAVNVLAETKDLAIEAGMNRIDFASTHGMPDVFIEESLKLLWWGLYVVSRVFATFHWQANFTCNTVELGTLGPSDEETYLRGIVANNGSILNGNVQTHAKIGR